MRSLRIVFPVAIILIGWWLRVYQIDHTAFRGDEAFTVQNWVLTPIGETLTSATIVIDPHPPLSYSMFRLWGLIAGTSEFSLRLLPALINLLGIAALYATGRRLFSERSALLLAAMWAIHAFLIWHSQDARNYAIWSGLSMIALAAFFRALHRDHIQDWIIYTVAALIAAYTYYLEIFVLAALNLGVLIIYFKERSRLQHWFLSQIIIGITLLPWYLVLLGKLQTGLGYGGTAGSFAPDQLIFWFIPTLLFGDTVNVSSTISLAITAVILVSWVVLWRINWRYTLIISLLVIIPMIGLAIVSTRLNVFTPRYIMGSIPAYLIGLAAFLQLRGRKSVIAYGVIGAWFFVNLLALHHTYNNPAYQKAPDWREITGYLDSHTTPDDIVIQTGVDAAFGYYYHQAAIQAPELALPASASQQETEIIETLAALQTEYQSIWLTGKTISSWANYGIVDRWAQENMQLVREQFIDGVPIRQFRDYQPESAEYGNVEVGFGDVITLVGAQIQPTDPDGTRTIWLYWRIEEQTPESLKIFLHLSGSINPATGNPIWSQDDHFPLQGRMDSQTWQVGTVFRDIARISVQDLPPGNYDLTVGWYDSVSGTRIITDQGTDHYLLETFEVK